MTICYQERDGTEFRPCRVVIPIKLEFSASVGFIHKESYKLCASRDFVLYIYLLLS